MKTRTRILWKGIVCDELDLRKKIVGQYCEVLEIFGLFRSFIMSSWVDHKNTALRSRTTENVIEDSRST